MDEVPNPIQSLGSVVKIWKRVRKFIWRQTVALLILLAIVTVLALFYGVKYHQEQDKNKLLSNPVAAGNLQLAETVAAVGKLISLPTNETPTLATVTNVNDLRGQSFFANAQNGDKVLIYAQSKVAILYRPSINKIIQIGSVNLGASGTTTQTGR